LPATPPNDPGDFDDIELERPDFITVFKVIWYSVRSFFNERPGQIIGLSFILIMLWGTHGDLELLHALWPAYRGPGRDLGNRPKLLPFVPWDNELISFWVGAFLLVVVPILIIKFGFKQPLSKYGLGLPPEERRSLAVWTFLTLTLLSLPAFWVGTQHTGMRNLYPFYRPFASTGEFVLYELTYLPFFIAIEFIFRGFLLFGLAGVRDIEVRHSGGGFPGVFYFYKYAILIQMLSYTAWHLGKPLPETWGTLIWGLAAGSTALAIRSIWPLVLAHWLLNVFLDAVIAKPF
jgi:Type II CAAX prenyl endopeptidase Rce1-like